MMRPSERMRDAQVYYDVAERSRSSTRHSPFMRLLTEPAYTSRVLRYLVGLPTPLQTTDRQVLETTVFDYFRSSVDTRSILFVGCDWYTRHYERTYFQSKNYWTIDPAASARKFGARRHVAAPLESLDQHVPPGHFDLIICNGVYGYGLDTPEQCERAFQQCYRALAAGGQLVLGWDDIPQRRPTPLAEIQSLQRFTRLEFPPLGTWRYLTATPYRHTYDFYCVPRAAAGNTP